MPRVAVLCAIPGMGGAELSLLEGISRLRHSYEFHLIVPGEGPLKKAAERAGAETWILPWPVALSRTGETARRASPAKLLRSAWYLRQFVANVSRLLKIIDPAAFITNAVKCHIVGGLARRPEGMPLIWYMRDGLENRKLSRRLLALLSRQCDLAICISQYVHGQFRQYVSSSVPAHVVYNIVDLERFHPTVGPANDLRKQPDEVWFGIVGPITPLKGHDVFLDAAEKVAKQLPNARFVVVGDNPYFTENDLRYEELLRQRSASALSDRVQFLGFRDDVPAVLSQVDVLVQPNRGPEGLGRSVLEALACGVPVITVDRWGPSEVVQHGQTGFLFAPLDCEALARHMVTLGEDQSLRSLMGKLGHDWMQKNFVERNLAGRLDEVLASVIPSPLPEVVA